MKNVLVVMAAAMAFGCGNQRDQPAIQLDEQPTSFGADKEPNSALFESLRSGLVQMAAAADSITDAHEASRRALTILDADAREAGEDIAALVDSAGHTVADLAIEPPKEDDVKSAFGQYDDLRKASINDGNDAYRDLHEALGTARSLEDDFLELKGVGDVIEVAMNDLAEAIEALGGQIEEPGEGDPAPEN